MAIVQNDYAAYLKTSDGEIPLRDLDAHEEIGSLSEAITYLGIVEYTESTTISNTNVILGNISKCQKIKIELEITNPSDLLSLTVVYNGASELYRFYPAGGGVLSTIIDVPENIERIGLYSGSQYILGNGNISLSITTILNVRTNAERIDFIETDVEDIENKTEKLLKNYKGLSFSIIGDSYSTYGGWIPSGNETYYAIDEVDGNNAFENNINNVNQTWWYLLSKELGITLHRNESWSGSCICTTAYGGIQNLEKSFVGRCSKIGKDNTIGYKPNIIFFEGGLNDGSADSPLGELQYSDWTEEDLKKTLNAFCYCIDHLIKYNPQTKLYNLCMTGVKSSIKEGMREACEHYGITHLDVPNIIEASGNIQNSHPNINGMIAIKDYVVENVFNQLSNVVFTGGK